MGTYVIMSNRLVHEYLENKIKEMLMGSSIEISKTGFSILNTIINCSAELIMVEENFNFINSLLKLWLKMLNEKKELQLDF
jgi:hypothetical protein